MNILTVEDLKNILRPRKKDSHKSDYGKVLIVGSSKRYIGAGVICANSCMRSGSGLVTLAVEREIFSIVSQKILLEVMTLDIDTFKIDFENLVKTASAIAIGCGLELRLYTLQKLKYILDNAVCPVVLDADAINTVARDTNILKNSKNKIILTPHEGEFARLTGLNTGYIKENRVRVCEDFAKKYKNVILILKGSETVISDGETTNIVNIGVPQMATGGMGDCLCGMVVSFLGQGYDAIDACNVAVFVHSYIANNLSQKMYSVLASDVINEIPYTLKNIMK